MPSTLNKDIDYNKLPKPIVKSLTELIARIKLILWIRGSLATIAVVVVVILIVMGIDAATIIISPIYRWGLSLSVLVALIIASYFYLYKPLSQPFSLDRVARFVELRHPELQERMSSIIELCRIDENSDDFGSQQLIDKLAKEATFDAKNVKPAQEINTKSVKPWFIAAGFVVGIIVVLMAIWPLRTLRLMARVVAPSSGVGSFFADNLEVEPGNLRMIKGAPLTIKVKTKSPKIQTAYIIKFQADGKLVKERMIESVLDPDIEDNKGLRVFTLSIPQVNESFRYCIHAGHSLTGKYEVQAEVPPQVDKFDFVYKYPEYTGLGAVLHTNAIGNINVLNGTEININANLSKPICSAKVIVAGKELAGTNVTYVTRMRLKCNFVVPSSVDDKWQMELVDQFSFTNTPKIYSIVSVKDQPPTVDIFRPIEKDLILSPNGRFVINYFGFDDYGLTNAFLEVTKDGKAPEIHKLKKLEKEEGKEGIWKGNVRFDLSKFDLKNVSKIAIVVCVADALPVELGGPQIARSVPVVVTIDREAEALSRQSYDIQHEAIKKILENVLKRLEGSDVDTKSINSEMLEEQPDYLKVDEDATVVAADLSTVTELLDDLIGMFDDTVYVSMKDGVEEAKVKGVNVAKQNAEMIVMLDKDDKEATGRKLRTSLEDSIKMIKNLFEDLGKLDEIVDKWLDTEELANKQDDLVEDAKDTLEDGEIMNEDWIEDQQDIADEISDALSEENPEAMKDKLEEVKKVTEKLAKDAEKLADLQDKLGEATKDESFDKLKDTVEDALQDGESSEKWDEAKEAVEEGDFDKAMAKAQKAIYDQAKDLLKDSEELETIGDMLTDNKQLNDANSKVSDLADQAQNETDKASEMTDSIEDSSSKVEKAQQAAQEAQLKALEAMEEAQVAQSESEDAQQAQQAASEAQAEAAKAQTEAQEAMTEQSPTAEKSEAQKAQEAASEAQENAAQAQTEAESAQKAADAAKTEAQSTPSEEANAKAQEAQDAASEAQDKAEEAQQVAAEAQAEAVKAQTEAAKAQAEAAKAQNSAQAAESEATEEEQQVMQGQQEKASEALSDVSKGLEQSKSALEEQIATLNEQIEAQAPAVAPAQTQPPMDTPMDEAMDEAMEAAMQAALDAQQAMDMSEMMPQSETAKAQQAAQEAQSKALEAMTGAQKAQAEAMTAEPADAANAQTNASQIQDDAAAAQAEAEAAQAEAQAALDAQLPTAEMSTARAAQSEAQVAQTEASQAQEAAAESQSAAQEAMSAATEAPSDAATAAAQQAQAEAAQAQTEAKVAQQAAQQAQGEAQQATQQADAAMMQAQQAMMQAQAAQQALNEMMSQQAQQLGMSQEQMQSMASMNQPQSPLQQSQQDTPPGQPSDNAQNKPEKLENGVIDLELLKNIGLTLEDWEKIKGGLKSGVTSEGDFDNVPAEYRALVREYFKEIANQVQEK